MDGQITPVHLIQPMYKHLMGWPVTFRDLEHIDDQIYRNLAELVNLDDVSMLYLEFVVTEDKLGECDVCILWRHVGRVCMLAAVQGWGTLQQLRSIAAIWPPTKALSTHVQN